jgi:type II secretory pathway predicted ATPase ExeA
MYLEHFGLSEVPFRITPHTEFFFAGANRGATLEALIYAIIHDEGIVKVSGEVGSGKTMLCRMLQQRLPDNVDTVYLGNPTLGPDEILAAMLADLGVTGSVPANRQLMLEQLNNALLSRHGNGRRVVAFVEEAQGMTLESLEFLRLLTNLETASDKLLQIVLFGQPELDQILGDPRIRQIRDRITLNLTLPPLNEIETGLYLRSRLQKAGYRGPDLFSASVVKRIARLSNGLSRRINILADKTLLAAFGSNTHNLQPGHVNAAARDAEMATPKPALARRFTWGWVMTGLVAGLSLLAFISLRDLDAMTSGAIQASGASAQAPIAAAPVTAHAASADPAQAPALESKELNWPAITGSDALHGISPRGEAEAGNLLHGMNLPARTLQNFPANSSNEPEWLIIPVDLHDHSSSWNEPARTMSDIRATLAHEEPHEKPSSHS